MVKLSTLSDIYVRLFLITIIITHLFYSPSAPNYAELAIQVFSNYRPSGQGLGLGAGSGAPTTSTAGASSLPKPMGIANAGASGLSQEVEALSAKLSTRVVPGAAVSEFNQLITQLHVCFCQII